MRRACLAGVTIAVCVAAFVSGCTPKKKAHVVQGCAPYSVGQCLTPFPNAWFEATADTPTGRQIVIPEGVAPMQSNGVPIDPALMGRIDGYSPATMLLAWFPEGVDATQLSPSPTSSIDERIAFMSGADSPIALVDVSARKRVPIFAELDVHAVPDNGDRQALIIHPATRLDFAHRYAVAITHALHDRTGKALAPQGEFARWVEGKLTEADRLAEVSDRLDEDLVAFKAIGIARENLALAWDFDTASQQSTTGQMTNMVSKALAAGPDGFGYAITDKSDRTPMQDGNIARRLSGTFEAPSFESGPDPSPLKVDANGEAVMGDLATWNFEAFVSQCAAASTGPVPLVLLGHGLFGDANDSVGAYAGYVQQVCGIGVASDFLGVSKQDLGVLTTVLADPNQFNLVTGRSEQGHLNFQVLTRLAQRKFGQDAAFQPTGHTLLTSDSPVFYWGESNGGIQGMTYMALSDVASRGVLVVPAGAWSELMWRSGDFDLMLTALQTVVPDHLDLQVVLAMTQSLWDKTDPIEFAPLMAGTTKSALFQESVGDPIVSNWATRKSMRTIGVHSLGPLVEPVYGLTTESGPLSGLVYTQWSIDPMPFPPPTNQPGPSSNGAHQAISGIPQAVTQAVQFLKTGQVLDTCSGMPCLFPRHR